MIFKLKDHNLLIKKMDNLTPREKLRLKITGARMGRLPASNKEEKIEQAKSQMAEMMETVQQAQAKAQGNVKSS